MPNLKVEEPLVFSGRYLILYTKKVSAILTIQFACNYIVNLNFDMRYLDNARLDFLLVRLLELFHYISKMKFYVYPLKGAGGSEVDFHFFVVSDRREC